MDQDTIPEVLQRAETAWRTAFGRMQEADEAYTNAKELLSKVPEGKDEERTAAQSHVDECWGAFEAAKRVTEEAKAEHDRRKEIEEARKAFSPVLNIQAAEDRAREQRSRIHVDEPDYYRKGGPNSFMRDLYLATLRGDRSAQDRIDRHQQYEVEKRAVVSATLGGILPPQFLVNLYAKALRNGRIFADQVNQQDLPEVGMSVVVPRITTGLAAGIQATENATVTTQDPVEADLTVNVRTIAGFSPVSRQTLERAAYSDEILFEDLIARYFASLDQQCISGSGASGQILGYLNTSGLNTSTASTATVAGVWPKIADVIQQINTDTGGLGYFATKIVMHPRRWGFFEAALDSQNRPLMTPEPMAQINVVEGENVIAVGSAVGYGLVGKLHGLPVYIDANIPTNLGAATNEDRILIFCDQVVHLWERGGDPLTLSFEQQAGTSLQVQLVAYGYAAFTAGRYPDAAGFVQGAGLVPPTF